MTNTRYIGQVVSHQTTDRLSARIGYKVVGVWTGSEDGVMKVVPPHFSENSFDLSADSKCSGHKDYASCSCGFYAYSTVESTISHWRNECGGFANLAIVQVALSGDVVVAENGYRASHQRIKRILMPHCWNCSAAGVRFVYHESKFLVAGCEACSANVNSISFADFATQHSPTGFNPVEVLSAADIGAEALNFLAPESHSEKAIEAITQLATMGRLDLINDIINHGNTKLNESLGL